MQGLKMQDENAWVEYAGLENAVKSCVK